MCPGVQSGHGLTDACGTKQFLLRGSTKCFVASSRFRSQTAAHHTSKAMKHQLTLLFPKCTTTTYCISSAHIRLGAGIRDLVHHSFLRNRGPVFQINHHFQNHFRQKLQSQYQHRQLHGSNDDDDEHNINHIKLNIRSSAPRSSQHTAQLPSRSCRRPCGGCRSRKFA